MGTNDDVWASSDAVTWVWVAGTSDGESHPFYDETFSPSYGAGDCQDSLYRQYRVGGVDGAYITSEVWMSVDGSRWSLRSDIPIPVYYPAMTGDTAGAIYLAGGILDFDNPRTSSRDVWSSTNQGRSWRLVNFNNGDDAPGARAASILLSTPTNALLWMTGVDTSSPPGRAAAYQQDVWLSTNQGRRFDPLTLSSPFGRRDDANGLMSSAGLVLVVGGYALGEGYNDVWLSANGGYSWGQCVGSAEWDARRYQMSVVDGGGYVWVMGGADETSRLADSQPRQHDSTSHTQPTLSSLHASRPRADCCCCDVLCCAVLMLC